MNAILFFLAAMVSFSTYAKANSDRGFDKVVAAHEALKNEDTDFIGGGLGLTREYTGIRVQDLTSNLGKHHAYIVVEQSLGRGASTIVALVYESDIEQKTEQALSTQLKNATKGLAATAVIKLDFYQFSESATDRGFNQLRVELNPKVKAEQVVKIVRTLYQELRYK